MIKPTSHFQPQNLLSEFIEEFWVERGHALPDKSFLGFAMRHGMELRDFYAVLEDAAHRGILEKTERGAYFRH
ncbi:hypothetical protein [Rhizobium miluonense]|uniref:Uncharacterized protein n=1 Tax=Rhizobium miluonense TaxID=411945 RepID=A0A1C3XC10_9HYPH|nr:hypothetical protein [Rhizobium miluonense]SCB49646.1 hypothetical protein GA0061102_10777 [Rhizobium miluonense]